MRSYLFTNYNHSRAVVDERNVVTGWVFFERGLEHVGFVAVAFAFARTGIVGDKLVSFRIVADDN